jgi:hypothetical protein
MNEIYYMHKTGMFAYEQDSALFYHIWASYNLFAIFPFPELAEKYAYYDLRIPKKKRIRDFTYHKNVLHRHLSLQPDKRYVSKNPDFSPTVDTLLEIYPDAKFLNLVRPAEHMIPSTLNLWASNWKAYGSPREKYPLKDVLKEHTKHWYRYPHECLSKLPPDRYRVVDFNNLTQNPKEEIESIYNQFGFDLSTEFLNILAAEAISAKRYSGNNRYPLNEMDIDGEDIKKEYAQVLQDYDTNLPLQEEHEKSL